MKKTVLPASVTKLLCLGSTLQLRLITLYHWYHKLYDLIIVYLRLIISILQPQWDDAYFYLKQILLASESNYSY